jgi:hypothetical protein
VPAGQADDEIAEHYRVIYQGTPSLSIGLCTPDSELGKYLSEEDLYEWASVAARETGVRLGEREEGGGLIHVRTDCVPVSSESGAVYGHAWSVYVHFDRVLTVDCGTRHIATLDQQRAVGFDRVDRSSLRESIKAAVTRCTQTLAERARAIIGPRQQRANP